MLEEPEDLRARCKLHAIQLEVRTLEAVIRRTGQKESRVAQHELLEFLGGVDSGSQGRGDARDNQPVAQHDAQIASTVFCRCLGGHLASWSFLWWSSPSIFFLCHFHPHNP